MPAPVIVRGIETQIATTRSTRRTKLIVLPVSPAEVAFLLQRLRDISATAESIVHNPTTEQIVSPWTRQHVVCYLVGLVRVLRQQPPNLFIAGALDRAVLVDAIEQNPYFASMHDSDPRLTATALRQANRLRERAAAALGQRIGRIPLGAGRTRIAETETAR